MSYVVKKLGLDIGDRVQHVASGEVGIVSSISFVHDAITVEHGFGKCSPVSCCYVDRIDVGESDENDADNLPFDIDTMTTLLCDALLSDEDGNLAVRLNVVMPENKQGGFYRRHDLERLISDVLKGELDG